MSGDQLLPVVVPQATSTLLTQAQARALADHWVSEHNRLPLRFTGGSFRDDAAWAQRNRQGFLMVGLLLAWVARAVGNVVSGLAHRVRRAIVRRWQRDGFALDAATERRLRRAFAEALQTPRVRAMTDAEQRAHLGEVLFAAQSRPDGR